ncbi:acyl carrier protein [Nocardia brasiliensis]|uniref:acyl carrier protein n=1 Tax=Nocardia brasiliensis TaxID=37326 RepID=UPI00366F78DF
MNNSLPEDSGRMRSEDEIRSLIRILILELAPAPDRADENGDARLVDDLAFHSLALIEMAFTLEDEFDLEPIDEVRARQIATMRDVGDYVVAELAQRGDLADATQVG